MFVATINVPGYLPMDDDPPTFDLAMDAWAYLHEERKREEDEDDSADQYSDTVRMLHTLATDITCGPGYVLGRTPGSDSPHDLGLAYCVTAIND